MTPRRRAPDLRDAREDLSTRPLREQLRTPTRRVIDALGVGAALEAVGRLGVQLQPPSGQQDAAAREPGALEQDVGGVAGDLRCPAAHHPGESDGSFQVTDH